MTTGPGDRWSRGELAMLAGGINNRLLFGVTGSAAARPGGEAPDRLLHGGSAFFGKEVAAVAAESAYAFAMTCLLFFAIGRTMPLHVSKDIQQGGLDEELHGEQAYDP